MRIAEISAVESGSTGSIMLNIANVGRDLGHDVFTYSGTRKSYVLKEPPYGHTRISTVKEYEIHSILGKLTGYSDFITKKSSYRLNNLLSELHPDLIHMHIMHGCFINNEILMNYFRELEIPFVWTFHDCWAFTGRCPHFDNIGCDKWKTGCFQCPYPSNSYPNSIPDTTQIMWKKKKELFTNISKLSIVTPSNWLAELTKQSFFSRNKIYVINNGIDLSVFQRSDNNIKETIGCKGKYLVLGVANIWNERKGLDVFIKLSEDLGSKYQIVLVGTSDKTDKILPKRILSIHHTQNQHELADLYSAADVFVNPTREDTFPTVNIEALACGTPVITFNTGGSSEIIDATCGISVKKNDYHSLLNQIVRVCENRLFSPIACIQRASNYDKNRKFEEYIRLYEQIIGEV